MTMTLKCDEWLGGTFAGGGPMPTQHVRRPGGGCVCGLYRPLEWWETEAGLRARDKKWAAVLGRYLAVSMDEVSAIRARNFIPGSSEELRDWTPCDDVVADALFDIVRNRARWSRVPAPAWMTLDAATAASSARVRVWNDYVSR